MTPDALEAQESSAAEIADLMNRYEVAISDSRVFGQSADGRYMHAYTAGFLLAKIVIRAEGVRVKGAENHKDTLSAVPFYMGSAVQPSIDALSSARKKRNATLYDAAGLVDDGDVVALLSRVEEFEYAVREWLQARHADLLA